MKPITISTQLAQSILNYLVTRPYQETFQLINALQQAANQPTEAKDKKEKTP